MAPPFRKLWRYTDRPLLEFPPIFVGGKLYAVNNSGFAFALNAGSFTVELPIIGVRASSTLILLALLVALGLDVEIRKGKGEKGELRIRYATLDQLEEMLRG